MFLISYLFLRARGAKIQSGEGVFCLTLSEKCAGDDGTSHWKRSVFNTGIRSKDGVLSEDIRAELGALVRLMYCIIEKFDSAGIEYGREEVIEKFKFALKSDEPVGGMIERWQTKFTLRSDLVRVGNEFKRDFQFIHGSRQQNLGATDSLGAFLLKKSIDFRNEGKEATARSYISTAKSLARFTDNNAVDLSLINKNFIVRYSGWLKESGVSESTQSFYLRTLRSALNHAKEEKGINVEESLFQGLNTKIIMPSKENGSPEIGLELLKKIASLNLKGDPEAEIVRDMFMFGFYCKGLELRDVLFLRKENLTGGNLIFNRRKKGRTIEIPLDKAALKILQHYKHSSEEYLFPLAERHKGMLYLSISGRVRQSMNKIKEMIGCESLSFGSNITAWQQIVSQLDLSAILSGK